MQYKLKIFETVKRFYSWWLKGGVEDGILVFKSESF